MRDLFKFWRSMDQSDSTSSLERVLWGTNLKAHLYGPGFLRQEYSVLHVAPGRANSSLCWRVFNHVIRLDQSRPSKNNCWNLNLTNRQSYFGKKQIDIGSAWFVLLWTTIFVITVVKMLCTHEAQPTESARILFWNKIRSKFGAGSFRLQS